MSNLKLKERIDSYQDQSEFKLLNKLPTIIVVNGRSFSKTTSLLDKPYSQNFAECMLATALKLCSEVEGIFFAYYHNDEIVLVSRNDQSQDTIPWCDNKVQKISSIVSSIATLQFNNSVNRSDLNILGEAHFSTKIFSVPNISEAINTVIYKQQQNFYTSIQFACFYELLKKYDKLYIKEMMQGLSFDEKIDLLQQECNVNFNEYPIAFRRGVACYKVPKVIGDVMKNKWAINADLPIFTKDQSFLGNIFKHGADIFRQESFNEKMF
jgi:tRNA(His) 5'-end guanylyltransferase